MKVSAGNTQSVAQTALEGLGSQYLRICLDHTPKRALPREADEISYACLLLCVEYAHALDANAPNVITNCLKAARQCGNSEWMDILPWQCCLQRLGCGGGNSAGHRVTHNLFHQSSQVRLFAYDIAWIYRPHISSRDAAINLRTSMASTLGGWNRAAGLCAVLHSSTEDFIKFIEESNEGDFHDQLMDRLEYLKEHGLAFAQIYFHDLEASIRKRIMQAAFTARDPDR